MDRGIRRVGLASESRETEVTSEKGGGATDGHSDIDLLVIVSPEFHIYQIHQKKRESCLLPDDPPDSEDGRQRIDY